MKEKGIIKSINGKRVVIERIQEGSCSSCAMKGLCNIKNQIDISVETSESFEIGEIVEIVVSPQTRLSSSFIIYIMPLLFMIIFYYLSFNLLNLTETSSVFISFSSLAISFLLIKIIDKNTKNKSNVVIKKDYNK